MMTHRNILITGGAGFVGSNLALKLHDDYPEAAITCLDNLKRRGSELSVARLIRKGVRFVHGDVRNREDWEIGPIDLVIDCAAEPSVLAGIHSAPNYVINTNLGGTLHCLEVARIHKADLLFLSTSRVYPMEYINQLNYVETKTRFDLAVQQEIRGASIEGISEEFPLDRPRSLYGATKLMSELLLWEYMATYGLKGIVNRCGVITGPWQMGKVDQGVFVLWVAKHYFRQKLQYVGYGGEGKQVRDFIHIDDLYRMVRCQLEGFDRYQGEVYNIGGGRTNSLSLRELTELCQEITGHSIEITPVAETRSADLKSFVTDSRKFKNKSGLEWSKNSRQTIQDIYEWIRREEAILKPILTI